MLHRHFETNTTEEHFSSIVDSRKTQDEYNSVVFPPDFVEQKQENLEEMQELPRRRGRPPKNQTRY